MYIENNDLNKSEKFFHLVALPLLLTAVVAILYLLLFEIPSSTTTYKVNRAIFIIDRTFDPSTNNWLVGVMDADNIRVGSFVCPSKPINQNPVLYYQMTKTEKLLASSTYSLYFSYAENCSSVIIQHQKSMPNTRLAPQRKKGEFIL